MNIASLDSEPSSVSNEIRITVFRHGERHTMITRRGEYRNLMALLYDKLYIDNFGECKGTGRCGTCHVHVIKPTGNLLQRVGNEATTLSKMDRVFDNSRLACQMMIDKALDGIQIEVISN